MIPSSNPVNGNYETYIETWSPSTLAAIEALANKSTPPSLTGVSIDIAFASFGKTPPASDLSILNLTPGQLDELISKVHEYGGTVKISFGGATQVDPGGNGMWLSDFLKNSVDVTTLANNITAFISKYGLDGIDFDIEDRGVASDFPDLAAALLKQIHENLPNTEISLTVPGQPWGQYWVSLIQKSIDSVDHVNFMEYDIWIDKSGEGTDGTPKTYATQIQWDINYYISNFGIPPDKIKLGLMPGRDDIGNNLTLKDAETLAKRSKGVGLQGIMTWDLNRDYAGQDGMGRDAFSDAIRKALSASSTVDQFNVQSPLKGAKAPKAYRAESGPTDNVINPNKILKPKPAGIFDLTPKPKP